MISLSYQTPNFLLGYDKIVKILIKKGANVNVTDSEGATPLQQAALFGKFLSKFYARIFQVKFSIKTDFFSTCFLCVQLKFDEM